MTMRTDNYGRTIIEANDYAVIITTAPRGERRFSADGGFFTGAEFTVSHAFNGKQYKTMESAIRFSKRWLASRAA